MKLDSNELKKMISEALSGIVSEGLSDTGPEKDVLGKLKDVVSDDILDMLATDTDKEDEENEEAAKERERQKNLSTSQETASALSESFQMTKGRLRQIITEEMKKAKEQGLL